MLEENLEARSWLRAHCQLVHGAEQVVNRSHAVWTAAVQQAHWTARGTVRRMLCVVAVPSCGLPFGSAVCRALSSVVSPTQSQTEA